ncbi:WbqC family protein [Aliarcobacter butzleri]|uniref:WbqC family protein n=1 Tax=Aliarcobacter butzleri TaxID=28197 RepID=UPI001EDBCF94|nr:WbqC family protein [Aliarcobacter butzleri]MCG3685616.1 WbqC family protein [Aliarcobacter butzleri]MCT7562658.1 WbqC family protein [Aliarcobacter butzleri]MCT7637588.1 WbqC family protein [Aliarcobacter butzleri]
MSKTVVIHQPDFLSYIGFFHRLLHADLYIVLDDVQFVKGTSQRWMNRDKIKTSNGEQWITVNVKKSPSGTNIDKILLSDTVNWRNQNLEIMKQNYKKSDYFKEIFQHIEELYNKKFDKLSDFNLASIEMLNKLFDIKIEIVFSSALTTTKVKSERLVELLKQVNATHYLSGIGAKDYHDDKPFEEANIKVLWQDFKHPVYPQLHGEFIPYLSSIDVFFNCGIEKSREILRSI